MSQNAENGVSNWTPFDYDDKTANPLPEAWRLVWVFDAFYDGVTIGLWADGWWQTVERKDDVSVTHWRPIDYPPPPADART